MRIFIKVKTGAGKNELNKIDDSHYLALVKELPEKGKANLAVLKLISRYFKIPIASIKITSGKSSKNKVITIK